MHISLQTITATTNLHSLNAWILSKLHTANPHRPESMQHRNPAINIGTVQAFTGLNITPIFNHSNRHY
eukprot:gene13157-9003_t